MADAHRKEGEPVIPPPTIVLEMTEEEAQTLRDLAKHVGGDVFDSRRRHIHAIAIALSDAGIFGTPMKDIDHLSSVTFRTEEA